MKLIRMQELVKLIGVSRTTLWRMERDGQFPARIRTSARLVAWSDRPRQRMLAVLSRRAAATRYRIFDHHVTPLLIEALCTHCPT